jgi:hypothetical protein
MTDRIKITRSSTADEAINDLRSGDRSEGNFSSLGMLIVDSLLSRDEEALRVLHDGLRRTYGRYRGAPDSDPEAVGRVLGLIDSTSWALRRLGHSPEPFAEKPDPELRRKCY